MNPCRCEHCRPDPDPTWTQRHRANCEARWLNRLTWQRRLDYFTKIERRRGLGAVIELRRLMALNPAPPGDG